MNPDLRFTGERRVNQRRAIILYVIINDLVDQSNVAIATKLLRLM